MHTDIYIIEKYLYKKEFKKYNNTKYSSLQQINITDSSKDVWHVKMGALQKMLAQ
jgi:hypothetical protein